jgi:hypothetical protein
VDRKALAAVVLFGTSLVSWNARVNAGRALAPADQDPHEPLAGKPTPKLLAPPKGAIVPTDVDQKTLTAIVNGLVACGTRSSLSSWEGGTRGIGCGRDQIAGRFRRSPKRAVAG